MDANTGTVYHAENARAKWHPASLTKMMTAYVIFNEIQAGNWQLNSAIKMTQNATRLPPSRSGLKPGQEITLRDALYLLIVKSANDIALTLAENISGSEQNFADKMNRAAKHLGMSDSYFVNPHGLHDERQVSSARDLAILSRVIIMNYPQYLPIFQTKRIQLLGAQLRSHNPLLEHVKGVTGLKTGYVCAAGFNIAASQNINNHHIIAIVLGADNVEERSKMVYGLLNYFTRGNSPLMAADDVNRDLNQASNAKPPNLRSTICRAKKNATPYPAQFISRFKDNFQIPLPERYGVQKPIKLSVLAPDIPLPRKRPAGLSGAYTNQPLSLMNTSNTANYADDWLKYARPKSRYDI